MSLSPEQLEVMANHAADGAVKKVFAILGVDVEDASEVESFRDDLRFGRRLRQAADHGFLAMVGACVLLMAGAAGMGLKKIILGD